MDMRPIDLATAVPLESEAAPRGAALLLALLFLSLMAARLVGQLLLRDVVAVIGALRAATEEVNAARR